MTYWNCGKIRHKTRECTKEQKTFERRRKHLKEKEETTSMIGGKTHRVFMVPTLGHCSNNWYMDNCCEQHM